MLRGGLVAPEQDKQGSREIERLSSQDGPESPQLLARLQDIPTWIFLQLGEQKGETWV